MVSQEDILKNHQGKNLRNNLGGGKALWRPNASNGGAFFVNGRGFSVAQSWEVLEGKKVKALSGTEPAREKVLAVLNWRI